jgi:hypothetical protein
MKLEIIKTKSINEQIKEQKQEQTKIEPVEVGKEAVFKDAEEQHKKAEEEIAKVMKPAEDAIKETEKLTASEDSKINIAKKLVKDRKELVSLITEAKNKNQVYKISRSLVEGFRYEMTIKDDLKEGAEGKKAPEGYKWVIYCDDEKDPKYDTIVAVRSTYTEARFYWMQHLDKGLGVELVKNEDAVVGKNMKEIKESKENKSENEPLPAVNIETPVVSEKEITPTTTQNSIDIEEPTTEQKQAAIESIINNLISEKFKDTDNIKSIITSVEFAGGNDEVITILNSLADEATMDVGMLQKALGIISPKTDETIQAGQEKADTILDDVELDKSDTENDLPIDKKSNDEEKKDSEDKNLEVDEKDSDK